MNDRLNRIKQALLELGLEDWIPLPEAASMPELVGELDGKDLIKTVMTELVRLLDEGAISVWTGHWADEPREVTRGQGRVLLTDPRRYSFADEDAYQLERVYYVNERNVRR